jgi:hypothetical protein
MTLKNLNVITSNPKLISMALKLEGLGAVGIGVAAVGGLVRGDDARTIVKDVTVAVA